MKKLNLLSVPAAFRAAIDYTPPAPTWRRWILRRKLKVYRVGGRIFTTVDDVIDFVNRGSEPQEGEDRPSDSDSYLRAARELDAELGPKE